MQSLPTKTYYPGLDALRGLAVLSVVFFHFFPNVAFLSWGWMGVDLFFVLSGFLITSILLRPAEINAAFLKHFYARRFLRIVPLCYTLLLLFFIGINTLDHQNRFVFYQENGWYYFVFWQNWLFIFKGLPHEYHLNHLWSLAVEEQFYLLFPLFIYFVPKPRLVPLILILLLLICGLRTVLWFLHPKDLPVYYCNTFTRMDSILFGSLLSCGFRIRKTTLITILLLSSIAVLSAGILYYRTASLTNPVLATVGYSLIAFINYMILAYFTQSNYTLLFIRRSSVLNYIGKISYGIYLLHLPVYLFITSVSTKLFGPQATPFLIGMISFFLTLLLSSLSFHTLESYFLRLKIYFPVQPTKQRAIPSLFKQSQED